MTDKAIGKSISFRPGSLFGRAEAYGAEQRPTLNPSEVVCHFLSTGLDGAALSELQRLAAEHRRLGGDPEAALKAAIAAMENPAIADPSAR